MKWWQTVDIVERESNVSRQKTESLLDRLATQSRLRREQMEREAQEAGAWNAQLASSFARSYQRATAADEIDVANRELSKLGLADQIPISESTIKQQIMSGRTWTDSVVRQAEEESWQDRIAELRKEAEHDAKLAHKEGGAWGLLTYAQKQQHIDNLTQQYLGERYPEEYGAPTIPAQIPEEGVELAEGIRVLPNYNVYSDAANDVVGKINPETFEFEEVKMGVGGRVKNFFSQMWKGIPLNPYYWMSPEQQQLVDYKNQLLGWAERRGVENPEEFVGNMLEPSGEVTMRAMTEEGVEPPPMPSKSLYEPQISPDYTPTKGEQFVGDWVMPLLIFHMLKIPGPKAIREALKVPAWAGERTGTRVAATAVRGVLRPAEAIQTGVPRAFGGIVRRIPPLKRQFIDKPLENSIRNYLIRQGNPNPSKTQINLYKQMIAQLPVHQTSARLEQETMRILAQKFGSRAVGRYYTQGRRMSEEVIKDIIVHAKKTGNTELQKGVEAFLQQWKASVSADARAELMRGDLFIRWLGELESGSVPITDQVLSQLGRTAASEVEGYYPALYHASMALEGEQAAHTLFVNNMAELFNIPVPDITASVITKIFGKGALPVTATLIKQLTDMGIPNAESLSSEEAWAALFKETLPTVAPEIAEVTGQPFTATVYRGIKAKGVASTDEGLVGKAEYWTTDPEYAATYGTVTEATVSLNNPLVIKTQGEWDAFAMRTRELRDTAATEGKSEDWVQTTLANQLKAEGYDGVVIEEGIVEKGKQVAVFSPAEAVIAQEGWEGTTAPLEEVTVTVEGLEPVKIIRKIDANFRQRQATHAQTKKSLVAYVNEHLSLAIRGKMLAAVKNAKTELDLTKAIKQAEKYGEQYAQSNLRKSIAGELSVKKLAAKAQYGKRTPETQRKLNSIKTDLGRDRETVKDEMLQVIQKVEEGKITPEDADAALEMLALSGIKGMDSQELAHTLAYIKSLKETGRGLRTAEREALRESMDALRADITDKLTGGKGIKIGGGTIDVRDLEVARPSWKEQMKAAVTNWQYGLDDILDVLSKYDKTSKPYASIISQIGIGLHLARSLQFAGVRHFTQRVSDKVKEIYGLEKGRDLNHFLSRFVKEKIELGKFVTTEGNMVTLALTKDQIIEKYLQLQDPTLEETFRIGMKWTDEMMGAVQDSMTAEDIKFADWLLVFYQEYGQTIKPVYEAKYHQPWPDNPYYSPLDRDLESGVYEHILMLKDNFRYAGVANNNLLARKKNQVPLRFNGATQVLVNHILQMEHFKAFAQPMKVARMVFRNKDIRTAIRQYHGRDILGHLDRHLDQIARDGLDRARTHHNVDILRGHFTLAALGLKPIVSLKQAGSLPAYLTYEEMPVGDFFEGVADFWKNPIAHYRELRDASGYFADRWGRGHERDIRYVLQKGLTARLSNPKNWRDLLMLGIRGVDTITTTAGSWAVYRSMKKQGLSKENAILHAEIATKRSQPSFGLEDMAALRKHGSFWQLLTMFQSQPNKYYRVVAGSIRNLRYGRGSKSRQTLNILLAWWLLPAFFQFVTDAFQWKKEHQARVALLGPTNYLLAAGQLIQSMWGWITHEGYPWQASPVMSTVDEVRWALTRTVKMIEQGKDPLEEVDTDYLIKTIEHYAKAAGQLLGAPTPYAVQLERAVRNADPRQLVFSEYALRGTTEQEATRNVLKSLQISWALIHGKDEWSQLTDEQQTAFWDAHPDLK